jgi:hypothetical protein
LYSTPVHKINRENFSRKGTRVLSECYPVPVMDMLKLNEPAVAPDETASVIVAEVDAPVARVVTVGFHVQVR